MFGVKTQIKNEASERKELKLSWDKTDSGDI